MTNRCLLPYTDPHFACAKAFAFRMWCAFAVERRAPPPLDLSGACKYGSLFVQHVFGGVIEGHYAHQYNRIDGRVVDLGHDARDVAGMRDPYLHEAAYFDVPEQLASMQACLPRATRWAEAFVAEVTLRTFTRAEDKASGR